MVVLMPDKGHHEDVMCSLRICMKAINEVMMNVIVIEETNAQDWEKFLFQFSASPFITPAWLESFQTPHRIPIYFRFVSEGKTIGVIAGLIFEPSYAILKKIDRSIFFFSGPAVFRSDKELIKTCIQSLINYATMRGYTSLDLKSWDYPYVYDLGDFPFYQENREEYIIDLRENLSDIHNKMRKSIKKQTRQAMRYGLTFHESSSPQFIEELTLLLDETKAIRRSKGYEDYSYYYIAYMNKEILYNLFQKKIARIFYVQKQEEVICILLIVSHNKRTYAVLIGTNTEAYKFRAPAFILSNVIEILKKEGIEYLNLGGVANDSGASGLDFFKISLGAEKYACAGGVTPYLQGIFPHLIAKVLFKIRNLKFLW